MDLILTPEQRLLLLSNSNKNNELESAFATSEIEGLWYLSSKQELKSVSISFRFWFIFVSRYLKLAFLYAEDSPIQLSDEFVDPKWASYSIQIKGGDFLTLEFLKNLWNKLNSDLKNEFENQTDSYREFLEKKFFHWSSVGKIHFHLAQCPQGSPQPFGFLATISSKSDFKDNKHIPIGKVLQKISSPAQEELLKRLLKPLLNLSEKSSIVNSLLESKKIYNPSYLTNTECYRLIEDHELLEEEGIILKFPKEWQNKKPNKIQPSLVLSEKNESVLGFQALFKFGLDINLDGKKLTQEEINLILDHEEGLIQIQGQWVIFQKEKIKGILDQWEDASKLLEAGLPFHQALAMTSGYQNPVQNFYECYKDSLTTNFSPSINQSLDKIINPTDILEEPYNSILKRELRADLRFYQKTGVNWLLNLYHLKLGGCLADDMGLGKTIQVISFLICLKEKDKNTKTLLIVPASLLSNWQNEIQKFAPNLNVFIDHPNYKTYKLDKNKNDLIITTYHFVTREPKFQKIFWDICIVDEAQLIKNPETKAYQALLSIDARMKLALTGTPVENSHLDLWAILNFCNPNLLGSMHNFDLKFKDFKMKEDLTPIKKIISPFILRRKKTDPNLIPELPKKTEMNVFCLLGKKQKALYRNSLNELQTQLSSSSEKEKKGLILKYLLRFKQICNHPSLYLKDNDYTPNDSGKFLKLLEIAQKIYLSQEKVLIFTQFVEMAQVLHMLLASVFQEKGFLLTGETSLDERREMIESFQNTHHSQYFVLSLKAAGTGLNLTKACHVIHFDRWWNPAVENQATDRIFRIGQKKPVWVHKMICKGTIEEKIHNILEQKASLSSDLLHGEFDFLNPESFTSMLDLFV